MEDLRVLYEEFTKDALSKRNTGSKAEKIRSFVSNLSEYLGDDRLCLDAVFRLTCSRILDKPVTKSYFKQVIEKSWTIETDDDKAEWIRMDLPRRK